jgi:uncharacterized protein YjlB
MGVLESVKEKIEKVTGWKRPSRGDLRDAVRSRKPNSFRFKDDGVVPNNPKLPFILYRSPVNLADDFDPAAVFEELFARNGWRDSWRNGIYDYVHYHSRTHEVLGVARGHARVRFGGERGKALHLKAGDVAVLPAGTGHQRLAASKDLLVVGAYPPFGSYDQCRACAADHDRALTTIPKVALPRKDPVYGRDGPLTHLWRRTSSSGAIAVWSLREGRRRHSGHETPSVELLCPHLVLQHTITYERIELWRHVQMSEVSSRTPKTRDAKQSRRSARSATTLPLRSTNP